MQLTFEGKPIDQLSIDVLQAYEPPEGYFLGFSGGKDSVVIYDLAKRAGVKFLPTYNVSPIDPPQIYDFIKSKYSDVVWEYRAKGFWGKPFLSKGLPTRKQRWCCAVIKEGGGEGRIKILGMRQAESDRRKAYNCRMDNPGGGQWILPILNWSDADVWQYLYERELETCVLYKLGFTRIGCILCPFQGKKDYKMSLELFPKTVKLWKLAAERYVQVRIERGTPMTFKTGEEYFNWWVKDRL